MQLVCECPAALCHPGVSPSSCLVVLGSAGVRASEPAQIWASTHASPLLPGTGLQYPFLPPSIPGRAVSAHMPHIWTSTAAPMGCRGSRGVAAHHTHSSSPVQEARGEMLCSMGALKPAPDFPAGSHPRLCGFAAPADAKFLLLLKCLLKWSIFPF